jgi:hypothetical protein
MTNSDTEKYSKKWNLVAWYRKNGKIPCEFTNPRVTATDRNYKVHNERLYGPKIMTGWIKNQDFTNYDPNFIVRVGMHDYTVDPRTDPNFRIVDYSEVESATDLIEK